MVWMRYDQMDRIAGMDGINMMNRMDQMDGLNRMGGMEEMNGIGLDGIAIWDGGVEW